MLGTGDRGELGLTKGKAGVKESLFLTRFLSGVFTSITTWVEQLQLVFSLPSVHWYSSQGWQSVWWHGAVLCPALCSPSLSHGKDLAAHSAQQVSSPTPRRPSEQSRTVRLWNSPLRERESKGKFWLWAANICFIYLLSLLSTHKQGRRVREETCDEKELDYGKESWRKEKTSPESEREGIWEGSFWAVVL